MQYTPLHLAATLALSISSLGAALAQAPDTAPAPPAPNPAAEQAVREHANNVLAALNGQTASLPAQKFTDDFNSQITTEQLRTVLGNVRSSVGNCQITAQMRSPISYASGYLLGCDKAFVPVELAVEDKAPYRIQSLLIRPGFWKP